MARKDWTIGLRTQLLLGSAPSDKGYFSTGELSQFKPHWVIFRAGLRGSRQAGSLASGRKPRKSPWEGKRRRSVCTEEEKERALGDQIVWTT